jgi:hypothetical protein
MTTNNSADRAREAVSKTGHATYQGQPIRESVDGGYHAGHNQRWVPCLDSALSHIEGSNNDR